MYTESRGDALVFKWFGWKAATLLKRVSVDLRIPSRIAALSTCFVICCCVLLFTVAFSDLTLCFFSHVTLLVLFALFLPDNNYCTFVSSAHHNI